MIVYWLLQLVQWCLPVIFLPPKKLEGSKLFGRTQVDSVSSAAVSAGDYFHSFGESPFGSNLSLLGNRISRAALGHRTTQGGSSGAGTAIRTTSAPDFAPPTHTNVSLMGNRVSLFPGQSALQAVAVANTHLLAQRFTLDRPTITQRADALRDLVE